MKKILFAIILALCASTANAAVYYGGAASKNINADDLWYTAVTGSCAGDGSPVAWATVGQSGNTLVANGCTITIPNNANLTITVDKISNKETDTPDADCVDGGQFTYATSADYTLTITAEIEAGRTADCIAISGNAAGTARATFLGGPITGGRALSIDAIADTHTGGEVDVGATGSLVTINGGSNGTARGYNYTATAAGTVKMYANAIAGTGSAVNNSATNASAIITMYEGTCQGGSASVSSGCASTALGGIILNGVTQISGTLSTGASGKIYSVPGAANYILMPVNSSYVAGTIDSNAVVYGPVADGDSYSTSLTPESEIQSGSQIGTATGTMSSSGGGGAWAF